jgi:hypothetical protein
MNSPRQLSHSLPIKDIGINREERGPSPVSPYNYCNSNRDSGDCPLSFFLEALEISLLSNSVNMKLQLLVGDPNASIKE